jgi:hypothetical protein
VSIDGTKKHPYITVVEGVDLKCFGKCFSNVGHGEAISGWKRELLRAHVLVPEQK